MRKDKGGFIHVEQRWNKRGRETRLLVGVDLCRVP